MKPDLDTTVALVILGGIAGAAFFVAPPFTNSDLIHIITGGLLGFVAKGVMSATSPPNPPSSQGPTP